MSGQTTGRPVSTGLFEWVSGRPRLLCGGCQECGTWTFPYSDSCPRCSGRSMRTEPVQGPGRLWTWTIQRFRPKDPYDGPDDFVPYGVGYVDFNGRILIEGRLVEAATQPYMIGQEMEICIVPYTRNAEGDVLTFGFRSLSLGARQ